MAKRVLLGKKGSDYGLFISKPGVDVTTTSSPKDLLFNSGATTTASGATSERSFRAGVIVTDTTIGAVGSGATTNLASTLGSDNNYYIPAYQIVENGVRNPTAGYNETRSLISGIVYDIDSTHLSGLPTSSGGGLWELTTNGSGSNINAIEAKQIDATQYENSNASSFASGYPWIIDRGIAANALVSVDILMLRIPCQYGKMTNTALFNSTTQPSTNTSGGGGSGGSPSAPTISSVSRIARATTSPFADTVRVSASSGANNSGTITYGVNSSNSTPTSFGSTADFTQTRGTTRYYFAKQGGVASNGTAHVSAAVDQTPDAFTFTTKNSATAGQDYSQASTAISGLLDPASVSVSNGSVNVNTVSNGGTVTATGTAASAGGQTVVTVTIGGVQGTFTINTTAPSDNSPDAFGNFNAVTNSELSTVHTSNSKTITGIDVATAVSISGNGSFSIAGGSYVTSGTITNNQSITVRLTSSSSYNTLATTTLTVGDKTGVFNVTTRTQAQATTPSFPSSTLQTNTSSSTQTVRASAIAQSGDTLQIKVGSGGSWANATTGNAYSDLSQSRSTSVTYYFRAVSSDGDISSEVSASLFIPPIHGLTAIANFSSFSNGSHDNTYSTTNSLNGAAAGVYTGKAFSITESESWLTATIANSTTGTFRLQLAANTGNARSGNVTYTISSTNGGPDVSSTFSVPQDAVTPPVTAIWEVNITQGAYSPVASFVQQGIHPFTGGGYGSFSNTTNTVTSINSNTTYFAFFDTESSNTNTVLSIYTSSPSNSGWTTLKVYNGTSTSGTLLGTFTRTSLSYSQVTQGTSVSNWDLGTDVTTSTGNRFLQFS